MFDLTGEEKLHDETKMVIIIMIPKAVGFLTGPFLSMEKREEIKHTHLHKHEVSE